LAELGVSSPRRFRHSDRKATIGSTRVTELSPSREHRGFRGHALPPIALSQQSYVFLDLNLKLRIARFVANCAKDQRPCHSIIGQQRSHSSAFVGFCIAARSDLPRRFAISRRKLRGRVCVDARTTPFV